MFGATKIILTSVALSLLSQAQQATTPTESAEELERIKSMLSSQLGAEGIDLNNQSMLVEKLRALKGPTAALSALALSFMPPNRLTVNELEVAVTQGSDPVSLYSAWALSRMGEKAWADKGAERLGRFQYLPGKINFGMHLAKAGRYDGWPDVEAALKDPKSGGAEFSTALASLKDYVKMRDAAGAAVNYAELLDGIQSEALKAGVAAKRLESLQLWIQGIKARLQK